MTVEQRIYESKKIIEWLVNGYFTNYVLEAVGPSRYITADWISRTYNVDITYFRPWLKDVPKKYEVIKKGDVAWCPYDGGYWTIVKEFISDRDIILERMPKGFERGTLAYSQLKKSTLVI